MVTWKMWKPLTRYYRIEFDVSITLHYNQVIIAFKIRYTMASNISIFYFWHIIDFEIELLFSDNLVIITVIQLRT